MARTILPLLTGLAAAGAASFFLRKKSKLEQELKDSQPVRMGTNVFDRSEQWVPPPKPESAIRDRKALEDKKSGSVTFFAGIRNPVTLELTIRYDDFRYEWSVPEEYFRVPTSATHAGFVFGEDVSLQLEISDILSASSFDEAVVQWEDRFAPVTPVSFDHWNGVKYVDGDILRAALRIPDAEDYFLMVSIIKEHKSDMDFRDLWDNIDVVEMVSSIQIRRI